MEKFDKLAEILFQLAPAQPIYNMFRNKPAEGPGGGFMLESIHALLDCLPEGVIQAQNGVVLAANAAARRCLPQLAAGEALPSVLALPPDGRAGAGEFSREGTVYSYSCAAAGGEMIVLLHPSQGTGGLASRELEGALYLLHTLLGDILAEVGPATEEGGGPVSAGSFGKTFHRLFRLLDNLEYFLDETPAGFHPVTMDLAGLCRHMERTAGPLLEEAGISLRFQSRETSLLIPGDPALLQKLLLELISNAARASEGGDVTLNLRRQGGRAVIAVSHSGPPAGERDLSALVQPGAGRGVPDPGQGAGLGLTAARRVAALHRGSLLMEWGQSAPVAVVSLPTGPLDGRTSVQTPAVQRGGGLDPVLMELSDLLPARVFALEGLE